MGEGESALVELCNALAAGEEITGIAVCPNPKCITNAEPVVTRFRRLNEKPLTVRCGYCERTFDGSELTLR